MPPKSYQWQDGENYCKANGGHLASINDPYQEAFLETVMVYENVQDSVWIGMTRVCLHPVFTEKGKGEGEIVIGIQSY